MTKYEIKYKKEDNYLHVHTTGEEDIQASLAIWSQVINKCFKENFTKILFVEETKQDHQNLLEIGELMSQARKIGAHLIEKIAFIDLEKSHSHYNRFGEINVNGKGVNAKIFDDVDEAIDWLESD